MENQDNDIWLSDILYEYLKGKVSADEETMIECWLKKEENAKFFLKIKNSGFLYEGLSELQKVDSADAYRQLRRKMKRVNRRRYLLRGTIVAACAVLLAVLGNRIYFRESVLPQTVDIVASLQSQDEYTILQTETGEVKYLPDTVVSLAQLPLPEVPVVMKGKKGPDYNVLSTSKRRMIEVTLADSTKIWLNGESTLRYPGVFDTLKREVYLKGEAYFEVAKERNRPFIVRTGPADIRVVGTSFNLNTNGKDTCVTTLVEGCIKMSSPQHDEVTIYAGHQIGLYKEELRVRQVETGYYTAWKNNCFAFHEEYLGNIIRYLESWYDCRIGITAGELKNLRYSTILYRYPTVEQVLNIISRTGDFEFLRKPDGRIAIEKKST